MKTNRFATICFAAFFFLVASASPFRADTLRADDSYVDADTEAAKRHFGKGVDFYKRERYDDALKEFEAAKLVRPVPAMDFNIARCYDRMERWEEAVTAFQRFIDSAPSDDQEVPEAKERIRILRERIEKLRTSVQPPPPPATPPRPPPMFHPPPAATPSPPPVPLPPPSDTSRPRGRQAVLGALGAGAIALVGIGVGLLVWEVMDYQRLQTTCLRPCQDPLLSDLDKRWAAGWTLVGVGVAIGFADFVLGLVWDKSHRGRVTVVPNLNPNSAGLSVGGNF